MGMKRMPGQDFKYISNELPVLWEINAPQRRMAFIPFIIEQCMANVPEVRPDLVGTPCFQLTFYPGHITETLQYFVMGNGMFSLAAVLINGHLHPVFRVPPDVSPDRSFILLHIPPYESPVQPLGRTVKELLGHSSLSSTQIYTHTSLVELKKMYSKTHPRFNAEEEDLL